MYYCNAVIIRFSPSSLEAQAEKGNTTSSVQPSRPAPFANALFLSSSSFSLSSLVFGCTKGREICPRFLDTRIPLARKGQRKAEWLWGPWEGSLSLRRWAHTGLEGCSHAAFGLPLQGGAGAGTPRHEPPGLHAGRGPGHGVTEYLELRLEGGPPAPMSSCTLTHWIPAITL